MSLESGIGNGILELDDAGRVEGILNRSLGGDAWSSSAPSMEEEKKGTLTEL